MTSTPTACPDCNNCGLPCLNEIHHPRQPSAEQDALTYGVGFTRVAPADVFRQPERKWNGSCRQCGTELTEHGLQKCSCSLFKKEPRQPDTSLMLDEWAERYAKDLREDIRCHIRNCEPEDVDRYILISIRQWFEEMSK